MGLAPAASPSTRATNLTARVTPWRQPPQDRSLIVVLARVGVVRVLVWFGVVQVIGLGMPAGREICSQRTVDESGNGDGVRPAGVPLQGEWHELAGRYRADDGVGVGCGQGRDQHYPGNAGL